MNFYYFLKLCANGHFFVSNGKILLVELHFFIYFCKNLFVLGIMHKILIVDDERPARDYIAELVTSYIPKSKVTHADSARNAYNRLRAENFDLLFVDIDFGVGKMTGLDLLEEIKRMEKQIYVIIISAHHKFDYAVKGMELGAARYIPKPLDNEETETGAVQCISKPLYKEKIYDAIKLYLSQTNINYVNLKTPSGVHKVSVDRLLAIEIAGRGKVKVYTSDALFPEVFCSLSRLYKLLPPNFTYINRNWIVNMHEVKHYNTKLHSREIFIVCQNKEYSFVVSRSNMKKLLAALNPQNIEDDKKMKNEL